MSRRILVVELLLIVSSLVACVVAYPHLPPQIVTHWNMQMAADGYSDRSAIFWLGPAMLSAVALLHGWARGFRRRDSTSTASTLHGSA